MLTSSIDTASENMKPIIIFGGTFNPIHQGHLDPVIEAAESINAKRLIYLPCNIPPHKASPSVTSQHRFEMVKLAISDLSQRKLLDIQVSDYEIALETTSYTRYTIEHFANLYPKNPLYFLIGMDSLLSFTDWYKWQEILSYCQLLVVQRPGYNQLVDKLPSSILDKTRFVETRQLDVSSTELRKQLSEINNNTSQSFPAQIPVSVQSYIKEHALY